MSTQVLYYCCIFGIITFVSCFEIRALQTGTFVIEDRLIRLNTCITKMAQLPFSAQYYSSHQDIGAIAGINSLSLNDKLNFYFHYQIKCGISKCLLELNLNRYSEFVDGNFNYALTIDYLVGHGLKVAYVNMTSSKTTLSLGYQLQSQLQSIKANEWEMIMIPNGFSNVSLTGYVTHQLVPNTDIFVIRFKDEHYGSNMHQSEIWPLNSKYIWYAVVLIPKQYLQVQKCNRNIDCLVQTKQFVGLEWTKSHQIKGQLSERDNSYTFQTSLSQQNFQIFTIPFQSSDSSFIDLRQHQSYLTVQTSQLFIGTALVTNCLYVVVVFTILTIIYILLRIQLRKVNSIETSSTIVEISGMAECEKGKSNDQVSTQQTEPATKNEVSVQQ